MNKRVLPGILLAACLLVSQAAARQQRPAQHDHHGQHSHHAGVNERGDRVMGFSHGKTTHHFTLLTDGGVIQVTANDPKDAHSLATIRAHLQEIAASFSEGDFTKPGIIHARTPPGVPVMKQLKSAITYRYEKIENGAKVRIRTDTPEALAAVHDFLRFQIEDHQTEDSPEIRKAP